MIKTYEDQLREHIAFLRSNGLDVTELQVSFPGNTEYVRCRAIGETAGRGEYCYQTVGSTLNNGRWGMRRSGTVNAVKPLDLDCAMALILP